MANFRIQVNVGSFAYKVQSKVSQGIFSEIDRFYYKIIFNCQESSLGL